MVARNNGGPAFPRTPGEYLDHRLKTVVSLPGDEGLSLRDYFAAAALQAVVSAAISGQHMPQMVSGERNIEPAIARDCYKLADAMLKVRDL